MANEWQWAECIIRHGRSSKDDVKAGLEGAFGAQKDILNLLRECLSAQELSDEDIVKRANDLGKSMQYASIVGSDVRAFAVIYGQQTEIYLACKSGDIISQVDFNLPQLRDGVHQARLPGRFKWLAKVPGIHRHLFWPELQGVVIIRARLFNARVPVVGKATSFMSILDIASLSGLAAGALIAGLTLWLDDRHWALALGPLWVGVIAASFKLLLNSGHLFLKKLDWVVSK